MVGLMGYAETKAERDSLEQHDYERWRAKQDADEFCRMKAALHAIAAMQSADEPVAYSWGLEYFNRAHKIAVDALGEN